MKTDYTAISAAKIQVLKIQNRVVNLHSSIWRFPFLQRRHAILNISFDQPETILRQRVYIHLSLHPEKVTECKLPFLINSATDSLDIRYGLSKLRITGSGRLKQIYRQCKTLNSEISFCCKNFELESESNDQLRYSRIASKVLAGPAILESIRLSFD